MSDDPNNDVVARQYQRWRYPQPIDDLEAWTTNNWEWFDPAHAQCMLWPERAKRDELDILSAGCGTNQAAVLAFNNPQARVVGIDVSQASLDHQQRLKDQYGLCNLSLQRLPIEALPTLGMQFDLIISTGVLHHLADPLVGMQALTQCLRQDGVMGIMLYATYGRSGVQMLQDAFADMGLGQNTASVELIREVIHALPPKHPAYHYCQSARDLEYDTGIVDTFLHGRQRSYRVDDCLELVTSAGAAFQGWFFNAPYHAHETSAMGGGFQAALNALPTATQWSVMERLNADNACHFFMACHPQRAQSLSVTDFSSAGWLDTIPCLRMRCGLDEDSIFRPNWRMPLNPTQRVFAGLVDGQRSIREIIAQAAHTDRIQLDRREDMEIYARKLFQSLWRLDFIAMTRR